MRKKCITIVLCLFVSLCKTTPLFAQTDTWAMVSISVESLRSEPRHSAELSTQALLGTPLKILEQSGEFYKVQMPDNYIGWIPDKSIVRWSDQDLEAWKKSTRIFVAETQTVLTPRPTLQCDEPVCDVVAGCILQVTDESRRYYRVVLPDGREGYLPKRAAIPLEEWAHQKFDLKLLEKTARSLMGIPYLWGGMSPKAADCSGFVRMVYFANGILLQRDASQQARTGKEIDLSHWSEKARKGDLLFIGNKPGKISHVGIYLQEGNYIHCSGRVKINSMDPQAANYLPYYYLSLVRIQGEVGTKGILWMRDHPWYF